MPRPKPSQRDLIDKYTREFSCLRAAGLNLVCNLCNETVNCQKRFQVTQHFETTKHRRASDSSDSPSLTPLTSFIQGDSSSAYASDLAKMFLAANIPVAKLLNPTVRKVLEKWTHQPTPSESSVRLTYVPKVFTAKFDIMKRRLALKKK